MVYDYNSSWLYVDWEEGFVLKGFNAPRPDWSFQFSQLKVRLELTILSTQGKAEAARIQAQRKFSVYSIQSRTEATSFPNPR